jgi:hypothetical protein
MAEAGYSLLEEIIVTREETDDKSVAICYDEHHTCCNDDVH